MASTKKERLTQKFIEQGPYKDRQQIKKPFVRQIHNTTAFHLAGERFEKQLLVKKLQEIELEKERKERQQLQE